MRIAVWYSLPFGGASRALFGQLTALREAGHHVEVWTSDLYRDNSKQFEQLGKLHIIPMHQDAGSLQYHYKNPLSIRKTREVIGILQSFQETCAELINKGGFDLTFIYSCSVSYMPFISLFLRHSFPALFERAFSLVVRGQPGKQVAGPRPETASAAETLPGLQNQLFPAHPR